MTKTDLTKAFNGSRKARIAFANEMSRRSVGLVHEFTSDFFFHMNPLYEPSLAISYVCGRYEAAYDALRAIRPRSVLEVGCAQGLSTWLMTSWADTVVGLDILPARCAIGRHVFPEIEMVCGDWAEYLQTSGRTFDVIVCSHGPFQWDDRLRQYCNHYINIGYRPMRWSETLTGAHKISGRQLSFSTTLWTADGEPLPPAGAPYAKYYLRRNYLKEARHALTHGYALPL